MLPDPPVPCFFDLSDRAKLQVRGADAARYLQGQLTNDVRRAVPAGSAIYACLLTAKGRLVADVFVRATADGGFLLDADPDLREALLARLERYIIADDVTVEDVTDSLALLHLTGPGHADVAAPGLATVVPADRLGVPGTDLFLPADVPLADFKATLRDGSFPEVSLVEAEARRIAAGVPRWGAELDGDTLPPEAGLEVRAISYDKGCYVGQETVSRLKSIGHVNRHLRRLRAVSDGPTPLPIGARLHELGADAPGREIGRLTSAAGDLALGYVRRGLETAGTRLLAVDPMHPDTAPREVEVTGAPYVPTP